MTNFSTRLTTAIATAAVILGAVAPAAFADTTVFVGGNGALSHNSVNVNNSTNTKVVQINSSYVSTSVNSTAKTGGNTADFNTGSDSSITTGPATSNVNVTVNGSSNTANVTPPMNDSTTNVVVAGNGALSKNKVSVNNSSWFTAIQKNFSTIETAISSVTGTGHNSSSFNTDGSTSITTGAGTSTVNVTVGGSSNALNQ